MAKMSPAVVNRALREAGAKVALVKGKEGFYFLGGDSSNWASTNVDVPTVESLSLEAWIEKWRELSSKKREEKPKKEEKVVQDIKEPVQEPVQEPVEQTSNELTSPEIVVKPKRKRKKTAFRPGRTVRLKPEVSRNWKCPEGQENNRKARILSVLPGAEGDSLIVTERDLRGRRCWNARYLDIID